MTVVEQQQLWSAVIGILLAVPALIVSVTALVGQHGQQAQITANTAQGAKHEEQLNGTMQHRIEAVVDSRVSDPKAPFSQPTNGSHP